MPATSCSFRQQALVCLLGLASIPHAVSVLPARRQINGDNVHDNDEVIARKLQAEDQTSNDASSANDDLQNVIAQLDASNAQKKAQIKTLGQQHGRARQPMTLDEWWAQIKERAHKGAMRPHVYSNDGPCYQGLTMMGEPCSDSIDVSARAQTSEPTQSPSDKPSTDAPSPNPTKSPTTEQPTATPSKAPTTNVPTASPSALPTANPTNVPTASPTDAPSASPTDKPSESPTNGPTDAPSRSPTAKPTASPTTLSPTPNPSASPTTARPSATPTTLEPTAKPSASPTTAKPSASPTTLEPTANPSAKPTTEEPSASPSSGPSASPTAVPSEGPSASPTSHPSASPTAVPSEGPSSSPSSSPSASPTAAPSAMPSSSPTSGPSASPTAAPSAMPSSSPTSGPSASPTAAPSAMPSSSPTSGPSASPTASSSPTSGPSASPTAAPSAMPSSSPTSGPSASPTASSSPTSGPSASPTAVPSAMPSSSPTSGPSASPTAAPSERPSASPSSSPSASPTVTHSEVPSSSPSVAPSTAPSDSPTSSPSARPSSLPSLQPTASPSASPTTAKPSATPTTLEPTASPSALPVTDASPSALPVTGDKGNEEEADAADADSNPDSTSDASTGGGMDVGSGANDGDDISSSPGASNSTALPESVGEEEGKEGSDKDEGGAIDSDWDSTSDASTGDGMDEATNEGGGKEKGDASDQSSAGEGDGNTSTPEGNGDVGSDPVKDGDPDDQGSMGGGANDQGLAGKGDDGPEEGDESAAGDISEEGEGETDRDGSGETTADDMATAPGTNLDLESDSTTEVAEDAHAITKEVFKTACFQEIGIKICLNYHADYTCKMVVDDVPCNCCRYEPDKMLISSFDCTNVGSEWGAVGEECEMKNDEFDDGSILPTIVPDSDSDNTEKDGSSNPISETDRENANNSGTSTPIADPDSENATPTTDPESGNTHNDGLGDPTDEKEVGGLNITDPDIEDDDLSDKQEILLGLDPSNADSITGHTTADDMATATNNDIALESAVVNGTDSEDTPDEAFDEPPRIDIDTISVTSHPTLMPATASPTPKPSNVSVVTGDSNSSGLITDSSSDGASTPITIPDSDNTDASRSPITVPDSNNTDNDDGVSDQLDNILGVNSTYPDSDGKLSDKQELDLGLDPANADSAEDDNGASNATEKDFGSDGDGVADAELTVADTYPAGAHIDDQTNNTLSETENKDLANTTSVIPTLPVDSGANATDATEGTMTTDPDDLKNDANAMDAGTDSDGEKNALAGADPNTTSVIPSLPVDSGANATDATEGTMTTDPDDLKNDANATDAGTDSDGEKNADPPGPDEEGNGKEGSDTDTGAFSKKIVPGASDGDDTAAKESSDGEEGASDSASVSDSTGDASTGAGEDIGSGGSDGDDMSAGEGSEGKGGDTDSDKELTSDVSTGAGENVVSDGGGEDNMTAGGENVPGQPGSDSKKGSDKGEDATNTDSAPKDPYWDVDFASNEGELLDGTDPSDARDTPSSIDADSESVSGILLSSTNPTTTPTSSPTHVPSVSPTTLSPTLDPTASPTTAEPSATPTTLEPTVNPSASPTTAEPTFLPTVFISVPMAPFGIEIESDQQVDHDEVSRVTSKFLHLYFREELPRMGYPHYHGVDLDVNEVTRRQRGLRTRQLETIDQELMIGGVVNFTKEPTPKAELIDNLRSAAFAGETSKAAYFDALKNSDDPALQSTTVVIIHESDFTFNPTPTERSPGSFFTQEDKNNVNPFVIAGLTALSFVIVGSALFLYHRKTMRDRDEKDELSLQSNEAPDSVLLQGDARCSDSADSQDSTIQVPKELDIEPAPISLVRDSKALERAMLRANRNRSVIEKANERVERKSTLMTDDDGDSKAISFAEIIAKSVSQEQVLEETMQENDAGAAEHSTVSSVDESAAKSSDSLLSFDNDVDGDNSILIPDPPAEKSCDNVFASQALALEDDNASKDENSIAGSLGPSEPKASCNNFASKARELVSCASPSRAFASCGKVCGDDDEYSVHEGQTTDSSMTKSEVPITIELPPPPITMTAEKVSMSPNHQKVINALAEDSASTPFSLISCSVHNEQQQQQQQQQQQTPLMPVALGTSSSIDKVSEAPSQEGQEIAYSEAANDNSLALSAAADENSPAQRLGIDASPNAILVPDKNSSTHGLEVTTSPYESISNDDEAPCNTCALLSPKRCTIVSKASSQEGQEIAYSEAANDNSLALSAATDENSPAQRLGIGASPNAILVPDKNSSTHGLEVTTSPDESISNDDEAPFNPCALLSPKRCTIVSKASSQEGQEIAYSEAANDNSLALSAAADENSPAQRLGIGASPNAILVPDKNSSTHGLEVTTSPDESISNDDEAPFNPCALLSPKRCTIVSKASSQEGQEIAYSEAANDNSLALSAAADENSPAQRLGIDASPNAILVPDKNSSTHGLEVTTSPDESISNDDEAPFNPCALLSPKRYTV